jgi:hypothetical protein
VRLDGEAWQSYFRDYEHSAWRLEVQPTYAVPKEQPSIARFLAGEPKPADHNAAWHVTVGNNIAAGKTMGRVRVVRRPLTEYQRYQLAWGIPGNIDAGEDIRVLDLTERDLGLPDHDFWLFDEVTVVHLNFAPDGTLIDRELIEQPELGKYLHWRDIAIANSVKVEDFNPDGT